MMRNHTGNLIDTYHVHFNTTRQLKRGLGSQWASILRQKVFRYQKVLFVHIKNKNLAHFEVLPIGLVKQI